jgi:hypothetical protein
MAASGSPFPENTLSIADPVDPGLLEQLRHPLARVVHAGLHGGQRNSKNLRHVLDRPFVVVGQIDDLPATDSLVSNAAAPHCNSSCPMKLKASLDQASAGVEQAEAQRLLAQQNYDRQSELFSKQVVARATLDTYTRNLESSTQALAGARAEEERSRLAYSSNIGGVNTEVARLRAELDDKNPRRGRGAGRGVHGTLAPSFAAAKNPATHEKLGKLHIHGGALRALRAVLSHNATAVPAHSATV